MGASKRILIVDADPEVHRILQSALNAPGRTIEGFFDGATALHSLESSPADLLMTEVNAPGIDGKALIARARELVPHIRVVVMTAANDPETVVGALCNQAFCYFSKPFLMNSVTEIVDSALRAEPSEDDIEVLSARAEWLSLNLRCKMETADRILQFVRELGMDLPHKEQEALATAFREILLNAIEHGGGSNPNNKVRITHIRTKRAMLYYVRDPGKGFSMDKLPHAAISNAREAPTEHVDVREKLGMRPGGFGILMTRQLVDELIYNQAGNEVLLVKYLDSPGHQSL